MRMFYLLFPHWQSSDSIELHIQLTTIPILSFLKLVINLLGVLTRASAHSARPSSAWAGCAARHPRIRSRPQRSPRRASTSTVGSRCLGACTTRRRQGYFSGKELVSKTNHSQDKSIDATTWPKKKYLTYLIAMHCRVPLEKLARNISISGVAFSHRSGLNEWLSG